MADEIKIKSLLSLLGKPVKNLFFHKKIPQTIPALKIAIAYYNSELLNALANKDKEAMRQLREQIEALKSSLKDLREKQKEEEKKNKKELF